jgi:hypothetical protein
MKKPTVVEQVDAWVAERDAKNHCRMCGTKIEHTEQVGASIYAAPCGHLIGSHVRAIAS